MINVTKVDYMGGMCPWQLEGRTDDNRGVYVRVRWSNLTVRVSKNPGEDGVGGELVFHKETDESGMNGVYCGAQLAEVTKDIIKWPKEVEKDLGEYQ